jgi:hypothetical protein
MRYPGVGRDRDDMLSVWLLGKECLVVIGDEDILLTLGVFDAKVVLRHEIGHCNGWPGDHPRARPLAEY